jgi:hypothetical protein
MVRPRSFQMLLSPERLSRRMWSPECLLPMESMKARHSPGHLVRPS